VHSADGWEGAFSFRLDRCAELGAIRLAEEERRCRVEVYEHRDDVI
jgi:hypothetical protein